MLSQKQVALECINTSQVKINMPVLKLFILGVSAGMLLGFACAAGNTAASVIENPSMARLVHALVFPSGIIMIILTGSELFTGNTLMIISLLSHKIKLISMLYNWIIVYIGNIFGSIIIAYMITASNQLSLFQNSLARTTIATALAKVSFDFGSALYRGILCNILVCVAILISFSARDLVGKVFSLYFPIFLFSLTGLEHSIANMYFIPAGLFALNKDIYLAIAGDASNLTWYSFIVNNLIPVTIGNLIGGVLVALRYWYIYIFHNDTTQKSQHSQ